MSLPRTAHSLSFSLPFSFSLVESGPRMLLLETPEPATARRRDPRGRRRWGWTQTIVVIVAALGAGVLVYPMAASWFSAWRHDTEVNGYVQTVESIPGRELDALLDAAHEYNEVLPSGPVRDPYALGADGQRTDIGLGVDAYAQMLRIPGVEAMSRVRIPSIDVDLPIFHGTEEGMLSRGVGHLYGSSLPVGGSGTHTVLAGHTGFVQATLFDRIAELREGDLIVLTTLGEDLYYEVDQSIVVLPDETDALRQEAGHDYVTLVTCTPTGVNTHRILVRAERVDAPAESETRSIVADDTAAAGFPWWALILVGVPALAAFVVTPRRRRR